MRELAHAFGRRDLVLGSLYGVPVTALCGEVVDEPEDPGDLPVCSACTTTLGRIAAVRARVN